MLQVRLKGRFLSLLSIPTVLISHPQLATWPPLIRRKKSVKSWLIRLGSNFAIGATRIPPGRNRLLRKALSCLGTDHSQTVP